MLHKFPYFFLFFIVPVALHAQKLPDLQKKSLRAPNNIKIDGNAIEWGNRFQAYNKATDIFYTICNNDENLYLIIHASDPDVLTKITNRGVLFCINTLGIKKAENIISINYPVFETGYRNKPYITFLNAAMPHSVRVAMEKNLDSVSKVANKKLDDNEKFIRVNGIPGVDTLLSIYNREGIHAAEGFDNTMAYTCELSVSLKLLKLDVDRSMPFHIMFYYRELLMMTSEYGQQQM
jgi:hypothetical protein